MIDSKYCVCTHIYTHMRIGLTCSCKLIIYDRRITEWIHSWILNYCYFNHILFNLSLQCVAQTWNVLLRGIQYHVCCAKHKNLFMPLPLWYLLTGLISYHQLTMSDMDEDVFSDHCQSLHTLYMCWLCEYVFDTADILHNVNKRGHIEFIYSDQLTWIISSRWLCGGAE